MPCVKRGGCRECSLFDNSVEGSGLEGWRKEKGAADMVGYSVIGYTTE